MYVLADTEDVTRESFRQQGVLELVRRIEAGGLARPSAWARRRGSWSPMAP
jgi:hypothetical protein